MRTLFWVKMGIAVALLVVMGCSKDDDKLPVNPMSGKYFKAMLGATPLGIVDLRNTFVKFNTTTRTLTISNLSNSFQKNIKITLKDLSGTINNITDWPLGEYDIHPTRTINNEYVLIWEYMYNGNIMTSHYDYDPIGTFTLTENDGETIKGVFSFTVFKDELDINNVPTDKLEIFDGQFYLFVN